MFLDLIYDGTCKVFWHPKNSDSTFALGELTPGQFIGVSSLLLEKPEPYEVVVRSPTVKILRMEKGDVFSRLSPALLEALAQKERQRIKQYADRAGRAELSEAFDQLNNQLGSMADVRKSVMKPYGPRGTVRQSTRKSRFSSVSAGDGSRGTIRSRGTIASQGSRISQAPSRTTMNLSGGARPSTSPAGSSRVTMSFGMGGLGTMAEE